MKQTYKLVSALLALLFLTSGSASARDVLLGIQDKNHLIFLIPTFLLATVLYFVCRINFSSKPPRQLGFLAITPHRPNSFFALDENVDSMEKVVEALADDQTNVYSNLSKITLAVKPNGVFLEDKNYKISILVNRRRSRRCFLNDGDVLDMGELTLVFHSPENDNVQADGKKQGSSHLIPRVRRAQGKLIRHSPSLIPADSRKKTFYLTKNITYIGRSENNDLVPKAKAVSLRHSKIERVAGRFKLIDLGSIQGTFVNGRRVDTRFLRDGDEIAFESVKYTFSLSGRSR
ncbi:MAG: hypothetical protein COB67_12195 [SAR324 cluster bacterium]|uniref:FHA domain-containing protein n=1 Tax=SAR324 cluster bacterium TaxID=2024889 RepID=A0A2A4SSA9_9DELT|nr:MAG: hypothetical protein COB67_12195 [SAR324 cluster bacterium]